LVAQAPALKVIKRGGVGGRVKEVEIDGETFQLPLGICYVADKNNPLFDVTQKFFYTTTEGEIKEDSRRRMCFSLSRYGSLSRAHSGAQVAHRLLKEMQAESGKFSGTINDIKMRVEAELTGKEINIEKPVVSASSEELSESQELKVTKLDLHWRRVEFQGEQYDIRNMIYPVKIGAEPKAWLGWHVAAPGAPKNRYFFGVRWGEEAKERLRAAEHARQILGGEAGELSEGFLSTRQDLNTRVSTSLAKEDEELSLKKAAEGKGEAAEAAEGKGETAEGDTAAGKEETGEAAEAAESSSVQKSSSSVLNKEDEELSLQKLSVKEEGEQNGSGCDL